jgi:hypothetical protein
MNWRVGELMSDEIQQAKCKFSAKLGKRAKIE